MIKGALTHPDVISALARAGHTSKVLITDAYFPASKLLGPDVETVFLNFAPGVLGLADVLRPLLETVAVEGAVATIREDGSKPDAWALYKELLPQEIEVQPIKGSEFAAAFSDGELAVAIITGELEPAACIVLSLGLRPA